MNTDSMEAQVAITSSVVTGAMRFCWPDTLGVLAQAPQQRDAQAVLVRAAIGGRNGVAIGGGEPVLVRPSRRPPIRASRGRRAW